MYLPAHTLDCFASDIFLYIPFLCIPMMLMTALAREVFPVFGGILQKLKISILKWGGGIVTAIDSIGIKKTYQIILKL